MSKERQLPNRYWGDQAPPQSKREFFNAVTTPAPSGEGTVATIRMYGPIDSWGGYWGISTKDVGQVLDALPESVDQIILRINSPGGEVFEGVSILNMLRAHKASVTAVVDGRAASAASVIAAGCDDVVMSPGTQMMIHSPSVIAWGNAVHLRKQADVLDGIESSIIEIYVAKAGEKDWATLLAEETWLTAAEAVDQGLADRVAVIPDAGEASTVGEDETVIVVPDTDEDADDVTPLRFAARAHPHRLPVSAEPGDPNRKENVVAYDDLKAGLVKRLGVTDAEASDESLLAALDQELAPRDEATPTAPGAQLIDSEVLASLQADAAAGRQALEAQARDRRDGIVKDAIAEGRITPASSDAWRAQLDTNEEGTTKLLASLARNTIPVTEIGLSDDVTNADDALYGSVYGAKKES